MPWQKNCDALAAPPGGELLARNLSGERRACRVARIPVSTFRYESIQEPRTALRLRIREIAQTRVRHGYRKIRVLLRYMSDVGLTGPDWCQPKSVGYMPRVRCYG
jgi:hypothetical protein